MDKLLVSKGSKPRKGSVLFCANCGNKFYVKPSAAKGAKYCSQRCKNDAQRTAIQATCDACGIFFKRYLSTVKWQTIRGKKGTYCSRKCFGKSCKGRTGEKNVLWRGGVSRAYKTGYWSVEYREWRKSVFSRDKHVCQYCGAVGGKLQAHHIFRFSHFKEFRFETWNGITLCEKCHNKTKCLDRYMKLFIFEERGDKNACSSH